MWFLLAASSALLSAAAAVVQKKALFRLNALEFSFLVSIAILLCSLPVPLSMNVAALPSSAMVLIIGKSLLGGVAFLFVMMALENNQISSALPLLGLTPALTALIAMIVLGESLRGLEWAGIGLMIAGAYVMERRPEEPPLRSLNMMLTYRKHYVIFAAVGLFAVSSVADRLLVSNMRTDPLAVLFYQHLVYALMFAGLLVFRRMSFGKVVRSARGEWLLIIAVALMTIGYRYAQLEATKAAPVALVLAVKRTSILYASLFGGKLFAEERLRRRLAGATLIVGAGFIILRFLA